MQKIKFGEAQDILKEGDILLFRGSGLISNLIKRYTGGVHSHVAIAHKDGNVWMCAEFREFKGGRTVSLQSQVGQCDSCIDVFRPVSSVSYVVLNDKKIEIIEKMYTKEVAQAVSEDIIRWTGQPHV